MEPQTPAPVGRQQRRHVQHAGLYADPSQPQRASLLQLPGRRLPGLITPGPGTQGGPFRPFIPTLVSTWTEACPNVGSHRLGLEGCPGPLSKHSWRTLAPLRALLRELESWERLPWRMRVELSSDSSSKGSPANQRQEICILSSRLRPHSFCLTNRRKATAHPQSFCHPRAKRSCPYRSPATTTLLVPELPPLQSSFFKLSIAIQASP